MRATERAGRDADGDQVSIHAPREGRRDETRLVVRAVDGGDGMPLPFEKDNVALQVRTQAQVAASPVGAATCPGGALPSPRPRRGSRPPTPVAHAARAAADVCGPPEPTRPERQGRPARGRGARPRAPARRPSAHTRRVELHDTDAGTRAPGAQGRTLCIGQVPPVLKAVADADASRQALARPHTKASNVRPNLLFEIP